MLEVHQKNLCKMEAAKLNKLTLSKRQERNPVAFSCRESR